MLPLRNTVKRNRKQTIFLRGGKTKMALGDSNANGMIMQDAPNEAVRQKLMETMNMM